jgi:hypothetical protein
MDLAVVTYFKRASSDQTISRQTGCVFLRREDDGVVEAAAFLQRALLLPDPTSKSRLIAVNLLHKETA